MRLRINVVFGAFLVLVLAMALGFTAGVPSTVSAQDETGSCQYAVSGDGEESLSGTGISAERCRAILEAEFGPLGTEPGAACQVTLVDGEIVTTQGDCQGAEATETPEAPEAAPEAPEAAPEAPEAAPEAPEAAPEAPEAAPEAPADGTDGTEAAEAVAEELPATGSGAQSSSADSDMMFLFGSVAVVLAGGALAVRRRLI